MADDNIDRVLQFVQDNIDSVEQLSVLLLLRLQPDRGWSVGEITRELRSTEDSITIRLEKLYSQGILVRDEKQPDLHQFVPKTDEYRKLIDELALINLSKPYRVIDAIYSRKSGALIDFANAFKLKGDKK